MAGADTNTPVIYAVLLAAGASSRFGEDNKLLADIGGAPLVRRVAERLLASQVAGVIAVTGFEADIVRGALKGLEIQFTQNPDFSDGLASSLRSGVAALPDETAGAMIVLADMPGISSVLIDRLIGAFGQGEGEKIIFPTRQNGDQGNPVIWPASFFEALKKLTGDAGAKSLIAAHHADTIGVPVDDETILSDVDLPQDLADWQTIV